jgi:hypothetical protein
MRIAISGAACTGKSTTIQHFLQKWPNYNLIKSDYRNLIKDKKHSKNTTAKLQKQILDILCKEGKEYTHSQKVIFDRCSLDNLVYSMWAYGKGKKGFTDKFIEDSILEVRESMKHLDIIFVCTRDFMPPIEENGIRETNQEFVDETNNLFKAIIDKFKNGIDELPFFDKNDAPAIIDIYGQPHERIAQIAMYVTEEGDAYGEDQSLIDINELSEMQKLIQEQKETLTQEKNPIIGL